MRSEVDHLDGYLIAIRIQVVNSGWLHILSLQWPILLVPRHILLVLLSEREEERINEVVDDSAASFPHLVLLLVGVPMLLLLVLLAVLGAILFSQLSRLLLRKDVGGPWPKFER